MVPQGRRVLVSLHRDDLETRFSGLLESVLQAYYQSPTPAPYPAW
jgi:hypothetical protein